ncbi:MAG: hypothetical protein JXR76_17035 [Deltaproteobacteria bacterium]|nr:hypothetical protein [Deltaproteobacteria bacterium]
MSMTRRAVAIAYSAALDQLTLAQNLETKQIRDAKFPAGYELGRCLLRFMAFAFRDNNDLMQQINLEREGRGHKDMVLVLSLNIPGEKSMAVSAKIPMFDCDTVKEARIQYNRLNGLFVRAELDTYGIGNAKDICNRAWNCYKEAADLTTIYSQFLYEAIDKMQRYVVDSLMISSSVLNG